MVSTWDGGVIKLGEQPHYARIEHRAKARAAAVLREAGVLQEVQGAQAAERAERAAFSAAKAAERPAAGDQGDG